MKRSYVIDSSSLIAFVRYYLPFDVDGAALAQLNKLFDDGTLIFLSAVKSECRKLAQAIVVNELTFLAEKTPVQNIDDLTPKQLKKINHNWCRRGAKNDLVDDFQEKMDEFVAGADAQLILYAMNNRSPDSSIVVVTEETTTANDNKLFHKIPKICQQEEIECITLPQMLQEVGINWRVEIQ